MSLRAYIIEDEIHAQRALQQIVQLVAPDIKITGLAATVEEGIDLIKNEVPDFIFLDIKLGNRSGFDLLQAFPNPAFSILFVTAYNEFAIEAFKWNAVHYITKPINSNELKDAIQRIRSHQSLIHPLQAKGLIKQTLDDSKPQYIILKYDTIVERQALDDIIRLQADGAITYFYCLEQDFMTRQKSIVRKVISYNIGYFDQLLPDEFFRCHQSHIVNKPFVKYYDKSEHTLLLHTEDLIPVSRKGKLGLEEWMNY